MIEALRTTRRTLIRWLAWAGLMSSSSIFHVRSVVTPDPLVTASVRLLSDRAHAVAVGRAYLELQKEDGDLTSLCNALAADLGLCDVGDEHSLDGYRSQPAVRGLAARPRSEELIDALRECHRADFRAERWVRIDGWMLSRTELRAAAIVALSTSDGDLSS